jgi:hypothetical protein
MSGDAWRLTRAAFACAMAIAIAGCARARPNTEPDMPPLAAPLPPPRVLPPLEGGPIEGVPTAEEPPSQAPRPAPRRREPPRTAEAPPAAATTTPPVAPEAPAVAEASPPEPAPVLQLAPPGDQTRVQEAVQRQLKQADLDLSRVDYRALGADARAQYETAKRFATLAEQALKERNLVFAQTLADKAAAIAAVLAR